ncbi:MAG TPA: type II secretion system F family protein [Methylomirabilota bacterium]|nr:type II secretion system F family protein [Methylomirabilota bacterium]
MPNFVYRGRTIAGAVAGEVEATDRANAVGELRSRGILVTAVTERRTRAATSARRGGGGKVKDRELAVYTRQFSAMIDAGLPITQCLSILAEQTESKHLRNVTQQIVKEVEAGAALADSFRKFPRVFNDLFTNMLQAGESAGVLDVVLQRLAAYIEKAASLKRKVKGAMVYPATIISVAVLVVIFMMTFVIPTFKTMFTGLGADLPLPTKVVLWASDFTRKYILYIFAAMAAFVFVLKKYYATESGSMVIDSLLLKVPVIGVLIQKVSVARFTRTLGTMISSGVPILEALRITARSAGNRVVEKAVMQARAAVTSGRTLAEPLRTAAVFPPMVVHMINVGESTGALDQMLAKVADFYDDEVDTAVGALMSLLEPAMIVILGVIIGGLVVALYLPIFKIVTLIK